jgi:hypothetical protein
MSLQTSHCFGVLLTLRKFLQGWGDYAGMNQGVVIYMTFSGDLLLICWFGTQLTQHVRKNDICFMKIEVHNDQGHDIIRQ